MESRSEVYKRVAWRFVASYTVPVVFCYLAMALLARRLRRLFKPFGLHRALIVHNTVCVVLSIASMVILIIGLIEEGTVVKITGVGNSHLFRQGLWIYWVSKYYELLDTVFMLLRHRLRQMSFLHVFHHASMAFLSDYAYNYAPWPPIAFGLAINAGIHIVMYSYYTLTAFYPLESFSWKKRVTQMQLAQFLFGIVISTNGYLYEGYCIYAVLYPFVLIILFSNYYYHSFLLNKKKE